MEKEGGFLLEQSDDVRMLKAKVKNSRNFLAIVYVLVLTQTQ
jgi:hypothetical protein